MSCLTVAESLYYGILRRQYLCDDGARPGQGEESAQAFNPQSFDVAREG